MKVLIVNAQMLILACTVVLAGTFSAVASPSPYYVGAQSYDVANSQQAARLVKGRFGGKILKVQRTKVNGNPGYKVKLLKDNGHVISVKIDATNGKISRK